MYFQLDLPDMAGADHELDSAKTFAFQYTFTSNETVDLQYYSTVSLYLVSHLNG